MLVGIFRGEWMTMQRWLIAAAVTCVAATGCSEAPEGNTAHTTRRPQQAGPTNPLVTAGHLAGVEAADLTGDQRAMRGHVEAMHKDMMRSMHLADPSRPLDREAARAAMRPLQGASSSVWIDRSNPLVMVGGGQYRSMDTIDRVCLALEPLGDTLGVVVNVQDVMATTSEGRGYVVAELAVGGRGAGDLAVEAAGGCAGSGTEVSVSGAAGWQRRIVTRTFTPTSDLKAA
jgi:hypothetical protein